MTTATVAIIHGPGEPGSHIRQLVADHGERTDCAIVENYHLPLLVVGEGVKPSTNGGWPRQLRCLGGDATRGWYFAYTIIGAAYGGLKLGLLCLGRPDNKVVLATRPRRG